MNDGGKGDTMEKMRNMGVKWGHEEKKWMRG